jgi:hypothetical protein
MTAETTDSDAIVARVLGDRINPAEKAAFDALLDFPTEIWCSEGAIVGTLTVKGTYAIINKLHRAGFALVERVG